MEMIAIGKIRTSHGIKGYLKISSYSGETKHFFKLKKFELRSKSMVKFYEIEDMKPLGDSVMVKLKGLESPETARALSGWEIWVSRDLASSASDDEYYHADLCLCDVYFEEELIGHVKTMFEGGGGDLMEVELTSGKISLIPFRAEFVGDVSIKDKRIELNNRWILG